MNHDISNAHTPLKSLNPSQLAEETKAMQAIKQDAYDNVTYHADGAYEVIHKSGIHEVFAGEGGVALHTKISSEDEMNLAADGKLHLAFNGINNDIDAAAKYALQHSTAEGGPQYFVHFENAKTTIGELMVAAYQKFFENSFFGMTASSKKLDQFMDTHGQEGLHLDAHSRGGMTVGNALEQRVKDPENKGSLSGTTISFYGPAYNAEKADKLLAQLQDRYTIEDAGTKEQMKLKLENHFADPVGTWIGGNPATGGALPEGMSVGKARVEALYGDTTVHNCYGKPSREACEKFRENREDRFPSKLIGLD
ncbi:MAG: hypothetical protein U1E78_03010 [Gammaproteobacteria bacterium]